MPLPGVCPAVASSQNGIGRWQREGPRFVSVNCRPLWTAKKANIKNKKTAARYYLWDISENTHLFAAKVNRRTFAPTAVFPKRDGLEQRFTLRYLAAGKRMEEGIGEVRWSVGTLDGCGNEIWECKTGVNALAGVFLEASAKAVVTLLR